MPVSVHEAFRYCERLAKSHYENFPIGWFLPASHKKYVYAIYAFARIADDFADEGQDRDKALEDLRSWELHLEAAYQGKAEHPVFVALKETLHRFPLPKELFLDLLTAFKLDLNKRRYHNFEELCEYCRYSANPIGRMALILFGYQDAQLLTWSDQICTGIQLVNHWQDVALDLKNDRIYLPQEDMRYFGYSEEKLKQHAMDESFRRLMEYEVNRARSFLQAGAPLLNHLKGMLQWQVRLMWRGPMEVLKRIERVTYNVFDARPRLSKWDWIRFLLKSCGWHGGDRF